MSANVDTTCNKRSVVERGDDDLPAILLLDRRILVAFDGDDKDGMV
jgi:hypothetical protein